MLIDRLNAVVRQAEALSVQAQERLAAIWEAELEALDEQEWDDILRKPGSAQFLKELVEEGRQEYDAGKAEELSSRTHA
ncbi:MAG TPA: hypothetical protein VF116_06385 [Ktedonobacterales bacterium]